MYFYNIFYRPINPIQNGASNAAEEKQPESAFRHAPPFSGPPPFALPPPGFPVYNQPWNPMNTQWPNVHMNPLNTLVDPKDTVHTINSKPGEIDPTIIAKAAEWTEHRAPDGRPYYYHAQRGQSVWEKPQEIRDLEMARMAAFSSNTPTVSAPTPTATQIALAHSAQSANANTVATPTTLQTKQPSLEHLATSPNVATEVENDASKKLEEKKKKEEKPQPQKVQDKTRPISSTPISGTPWCVVWTGDGRVFFYNPSTRTSVWERPEDLIERADVDKLISTLPEQLAEAEDKEKPEEEVVPQIKQRTESVSSETSDEPASKKPKVEEKGTSYCLYFTYIFNFYTLFTIRYFSNTRD